MARRGNNEWDIALACGQLLGVFLALGFVFPQFRSVIFGLGTLAVWLVIIATGGLLVYGVGKLLILRKRSRGAIDLQPGVSSLSAEKSSQPTIAASNILAHQLRSIDWFQFERLLALVYRKQGYQVSLRGGAKADGGIDLILEKASAHMAVQCKHWKSIQIGVATVREFLGALTDSGFTKGILVSLSPPTTEALAFASKHGIQLLGEKDVLEMLECCGVENDLVMQSALDPAQKHCPKCESKMVLRTAQKGPHAGSCFWGCSRFPQCRFTFPVHEPISTRKRGEAEVPIAS